LYNSPYRGKEKKTPIRQGSLRERKKNSQNQETFPGAPEKGGGSLWRGGADQDFGAGRKNYVTN